MAESHCGGALFSRHYERSSLLFPEQPESLSLLPRLVPLSSLRLCPETAHRTPEAWQPPGSHRWSNILFSRTLLFRVHAPRSTEEQPSAPVPQKVRAAPCPITVATPDIQPTGREHAAAGERRPKAGQYHEDAHMPHARPAG